MNEPRYIWSYTGRVYHDTWHLGERCNTDALKNRDAGDFPPKRLRLCLYCERQATKEAQ